MGLRLKTLERADRFSLHCMGQRMGGKIVSKTCAILVPYSSSNTWQLLRV